jgi:hypothetical protein
MTANRHTESVEPTRLTISTVGKLLVPSADCASLKLSDRPSIVADLQALINAPDSVGRFGTKRHIGVEPKGAGNVFADESDGTIGQSEIGSLGVLAAECPPWEGLLSSED